MSPSAVVTPKIRQIDHEIDAVTRALRGHEKIDRLSASSWQTAWDRHPELYAQFNDLYRQRGVAQKERDTAIDKSRIKRASRPLRWKECPTCKCHTLAA